MKKIYTVLVIIGLALATAIGAVYPLQQPVVTQEPVVVGSTAVNVFDGQCFNVNGAIKCLYSKALTTATTTPCAFRSPAATSTLVTTSLAFSTASSTAIRLDLATSTSAFATTTMLYSFSQASGVVLGFNFTASTSSATVPDKAIIAPNTWLVWGMNGIIGADATKLNGRCMAEFNTI